MFSSLETIEVFKYNIFFLIASRARGEKIFCWIPIQTHVITICHPTITWWHLQIAVIPKKHGGVFKLLAEVTYQSFIFIALSIKFSQILLKFDIARIIGKLSNK